jgi:hypothetical protein
VIYRTQLIYVVEGQEAVFDEFEAIAIPIIRKYNGELILRVRPSPDALIEGTLELPYEIHLVSFPSQADCDDFSCDEERKSFLHLKEKSIRAAIQYQGELV